VNKHLTALIKVLPKPHWPNARPKTFQGMSSPPYVLSSLFSGLRFVLVRLRTNNRFSIDLENPDHLEECSKNLFDPGVQGRNQDFGWGGTKV
jgi:hypothetical protein